MKSIDIYKILNLHLKENFKLLGYKKVKNCQLGWYKSLEANFIRIEFQCNKWGWTIDTGTDFTIYIGYCDELSALFPLKQAYLSDIFSSSDLEELLSLQNSVITKFKKPTDLAMRKAAPTAGQDFHDFFKKQFEPLSYPLSSLDTMTMRCYDENDVHKWGDFLQQRLNTLANALELRWSTNMPVHSDAPEGGA
jgi:hypothetical protein